MAKSLAEILEESRTLAEKLFRSSGVITATDGAELALLIVDLAKTQIERDKVNGPR